MPELVGAISLSNSIRLVSNSGCTPLKPVMFPPGRERLSTTRSGSPTSHHHRNCARRLLGCKRRGRAACDDQIDIESINSERSAGNRLASPSADRC